MMMSMNVPKYLWGQAVLTATYLINRMPSRVLDWKSPIEMLKGKNGDVLPLKTFGCVRFVQDNKPNVGKLDPKVVKCVRKVFDYPEGVCLLESDREEIVC
jgi:hypothetical protein